MTVARNSQTVLEALRLPTAPSAQVSQLALDVLRTALATASESQTVLEILRVNGVEVPLTTVTSVTANTGSTAGGTAVTIAGTGFTGATGATFGGSAATSFSVVNDTTITCTTPAHAAGAVSVAVTGAPGGTGTLASGFTYSAASVTSVTANHGPAAGGTAVTIAGSGFTGATGATFGGSPGTSFAVASDTTITCTTPAHAGGAVSVVVTLADASTSTLLSGYTFNPASSGDGDGVEGVGEISGAAGAIEHHGDGAHVAGAGSITDAGYKPQGTGVEGAAEIGPADPGTRNAAGSAVGVSGLGRIFLQGGSGLAGVGEIGPAEAGTVNRAGAALGVLGRGIIGVARGSNARSYLVRPTVIYRTYRSDDLTRPLVGPVTLEIRTIAFRKEGASFEAKAPSLNVNRTGELYSIARFPTLRGFL